MTVTLALPSKGRLKDQATEALARAGLVVVAPSDARQYNARIKDFEKVEIAYLSASEIAREVGEGHVDLGVTGEDLLCETFADWSERTEIAARLGFGRADVVVAVPEVWLDVTTMADLDDVAADFRQRHGRRLTIATKYWRLTQQFFSQLHGIQVHTGQGQQHNLTVRTVLSLGQQVSSYMGRVGTLICGAETQAGKVKGPSPAAL